MHLFVLLLLVVAAVFGPGMWVRHVLQRYSQPADRYQGTGAELARHLLDALQMPEVLVEQTEKGDHYDPLAKTVRLLPEHFGGHSLTAITVAAHEVGHAIQDQQAYPPLRLRTSLVKLTAPLEKLGALVLMAAPAVGLMSRAPSLGVLMIAGGLLSLGTGAIVHLLTLPTELDASFRKALPLLEDNSILLPQDLPHARRILRAAAWTYLSASLMSLLNVARWWAILRR